MWVHVLKIGKKAQIWKLAKRMVFGGEYVFPKNDFFDKTISEVL